MEIEIPTWALWAAAGVGGFVIYSVVAAIVYATFYWFESDWEPWPTSMMWPIWIVPVAVFYLIGWFPKWGGEKISAWLHRRANHEGW